MKYQSDLSCFMGVLWSYFLLFYQTKMEFFKNEVKCINEKSYSICNKKHYLKHMKDSASDWYILTVFDVMEIYRHVIKRCN